MNFTEKERKRERRERDEYLERNGISLVCENYVKEKSS